MEFITKINKLIDELLEDWEFVDKNAYQNFNKADTVYSIRKINEIRQINIIIPGGYTWTNFKKVNPKDIGLNNMLEIYQIMLICLENTYKNDINKTNLGNKKLKEIKHFISDYKNFLEDKSNFSSKQNRDNCCVIN